MRNSGYINLATVSDQIELCGKVQCALALNLLDQPDCTQPEGNDEGIDLRIDDMFTIGVRTICDVEDCLFVDTAKAQALVYILVTFDTQFSTFRILGWTTIAQLMQSPIKNQNGGSFYVFPSSALRPLNELRTRLNLPCPTIEVWDQDYLD